MVLWLLLPVTVADGLLAGIEPAGEDVDRVPHVLAEKVIGVAAVIGGAIDRKVGKLGRGGGNDRHLAYRITRLTAAEKTECAAGGGGSGGGCGARGYWGNRRMLGLLLLGGLWSGRPLGG